MKRWHYLALFFLFALAPISGSEETIEIPDEEILPIVALSEEEIKQIQQIQAQLVSLEERMREVFKVRNILIQAAAERKSVNLAAYDYVIEDGTFIPKQKDINEERTP